ncbi:hypothetical protein GQ53DRAFT_417010 [Thozetella sp. PMI_491]|nr:hypothetical protein GQ53DRAFT_417010 [Thozetella sp. PMI_491]
MPTLQEQTAASEIWIFNVTAKYNRACLAAAKAMNSRTEAHQIANTLEQLYLPRMLSFNSLMLVFWEGRRSIGLTRETLLGHLPPGNGELSSNSLAILDMAVVARGRIQASLQNALTELSEEHRVVLQAKSEATRTENALRYCEAEKLRWARKLELAEEIRQEILGRIWAALLDQLASQEAQCEASSHGAPPLRLPAAKEPPQAASASRMTLVEQNLKQRILSTASLFSVNPGLTTPQAMAASLKTPKLSSVSTRLGRCKTRGQDLTCTEDIRECTKFDITRLRKRSSETNFDTGKRWRRDDVSSEFGGDRPAFNTRSRAPVISFSRPGN